VPTWSQQDLAELRRQTQPEIVVVVVAVVLVERLLPGKIAQRALQGIEGHASAYVL